MKTIKFTKRAIARYARFVPYHNPRPLPRAYLTIGIRLLAIIVLFGGILIAVIATGRQHGIVDATKDMPEFKLPLSGTDPAFAQRYTSNH